MEIKKQHKIRKAWIWDATIEKFIFNILRKYSNITYKRNVKILNCPCGKSRIGTHFCDADKNVFTEEELEDEEHYKIADMRELPYKDNYFDIAISDPPWKLKYFKRFKPYYELTRVVKNNGLVIYNATWIPTSKYDEVLEVYVRQDVAFGLTSIFSIIRVVK